MAVENISLHQMTFSMTRDLARDQGSAYPRLEKKSLFSFSFLSSLFSRLLHVTLQLAKKVRARQRGSENEGGLTNLT